jgi:hypothetical protein
VVDIGSGIQGTFNQAPLAGRRAEAEKARDRKVQQDRLRDARRRFITTQEEVRQAQMRRDMRVDPDKDGTSGQDARDQYESHDELTGRDRADDKPQAATRENPDQDDEQTTPEDDSGHLIDIEA